MLQKIQVPIIENKLHFLADQNPPKDLVNAFFFNIDNDLAYQAFYQDFGPLSIANIWKYINEVHKILSNSEYDKYVFYHHTSPDYKKCCNSVLLICAYQVVIMKKSAEQAYKPFSGLDLKTFRDASYGKCSYKCTILECLGGLEYALKLKWFNFKKFDLAEYEHYCQLQNGDMNWVIPGKLMAFSSPYNVPMDQYGNKLLRPKQYIPIFKKLRIKAIIRLNSSTYDREQFVQQGMEHYDLYFADGTSPPPQIVQKFIKIVQSVQGAVAVHCKAGLGRTGCLIACYAMKHYQFPATALIGWVRLCRPGSILGPQQHFLLQNQQLMHNKSDSSQVWKEVSQKIDRQYLQNLHKIMKKKSIQYEDMNDQEFNMLQKGQTGQGNRLVLAKKNHQVSKPKIVTQ